MDEFERGIRFAMEREENYRRGTATDSRLQFGECIISFDARTVPLSERSAEHLERRVQAALALDTDARGEIQQASERQG